MKHSYFSNYLMICLQSIFSVVKIIFELFVVCQKIIRIIFVIVKKKRNKSNFVYVLVHRNILMYDILACHLFNYTCGKFV